MNVEIIKDDRYALEIIEETTLVVKVAGVINVGQAGYSGNTISITAAEALGGHRVATMRGGYADSSNIDHAYALAGITLQAVSAGSPVTVQTSGPLSESSWNWLADEPICLGNNGMLTQTPPESGFFATIGNPINATTLLIDIQQPIILN